MGIGGALIMPATLSIITNVFPAHERGKAIGAWAGVAGLGGALGPLTGGFLVEHFYWGSVFLVNIPIVIFGLLAGYFVIPTSQGSARRQARPRRRRALDRRAHRPALRHHRGPHQGLGQQPPRSAWGAWAWCSSSGSSSGSGRIDHPMLDVSFFRKPRFTAASMSIMLVFFAMFGALFLLTQYFQFVLGYSPLETGIRMLPFAAAMMIVSPLSARLVERIGTKITVALGLGLVTTGLLTMTQLQADTPYVNIFWRLMLMAAGMGLTMAPATDSVMGSLPLFKAGVGSAVNDTTRQVGGAMGVAVVGSVLATTYGARIGDALAANGITGPLADAAKQLDRGHPPGRTATPERRQRRLRRRRPLGRGRGRPGDRHRGRRRPRVPPGPRPGRGPRGAAGRVRRGARRRVPGP